jgi:hypothetical protein
VRTLPLRTAVNDEGDALTAVTAVVEHDNVERNHAIIFSNIENPSGLSNSRPSAEIRSGSVV